MAKFLSIQNWEKYQARTDKELPWCKLWGKLFDKPWWQKLKDKDKVIPIIFLDVARKFNNRMPSEMAWYGQNYALKHVENDLINICKYLKINGFLSDLPSDIIDKMRGDKKREEEKIISQIENLLISFSNNGLKEKLNAYLKQNALKNKSQKLSPQRQKTLLLELTNSRARCADDSLFEAALDGAIKYSACNIGYLNAIIRNKKTQVVEK